MTNPVSKIHDMISAAIKEEIVLLPDQLRGVYDAMDEKEKFILYHAMNGAVNNFAKIILRRIEKGEY
jgi:hypothetical protein